MEIEDCIYFWSVIQQGEDSIVVDAETVKNDENYKPFGRIERDFLGNDVIITCYIKNPAYLHSGCIYLYNPINEIGVSEEKNKKIQFKFGVISDNEEINDEIKEQITRELRSNIALFMGTGLNILKEEPVFYGKKNVDRNNH